MSKTDIKTQLLPLKSIVPDENQPRKYFAADKINTLKKSIEKQGIMTPLRVEDMGNGKYLLEDGERRFRAATELGLKEVPAVVVPASTAVERLVRQFNVQEMHESWTPLEKAQALIKLSEEMGMSMYAVCKLLGISENVAKRYAAFAQLTSQKEYVANEIPLDMADRFISIKNTVRTIKNEVLEEDFTRQDEKRLELRLIESVRDGAIGRRHDVTMLKDSFTKNPKLIEEYLKDKKATPTALFIKAKAKGAYYLRNAVNNAQFMGSAISRYMEIRDVRISHEQMDILVRARAQLNDIIALAE